MNNNERAKQLQKTSLISILANVLLAVGKLVVGLISKSTAVLSDAVHTLSDIFTTIMVMFGIKWSAKQPDKEHPYGHFRIESIISLFLALALGATAMFLGFEGFIKLRHGAEILPSRLALAITLISIGVKEWQFRYTMQKAIKYNSTSMKSDAWHHRTDSISSIAVLIGVLGVFLGFPMLDPIATLCVCFIILKAAFDIANTAFSQLLDHAAPDEVVEKIRAITLDSDFVDGIDVLRTRLSNNVIFVELEIFINRDFTLAKAHYIAETVHDRLENAGLNIEHCMVHINPTPTPNRQMKPE